MAAKKKSSRYRGVSFYPRTGGWIARIRVEDRVKYLGHHGSEEDAARAYDVAAKALFITPQTLNFPK